MITDIVWTDDSKFLQESTLTARQPHEAPHHVLYLILKTPPPCEWRTSQPNGDHTGRELRSANSTRQDVIHHSTLLRFKLAKLFGNSWKRSRLTKARSCRSNPLLSNTSHPQRDPPWHLCVVSVSTETDSDGLLPNLIQRSWRTWFPYSWLSSGAMGVFKMWFSVFNAPKWIRFGYNSRWCMKNKLRINSKSPKPNPKIQPPNPIPSQILPPNPTTLHIKRLLKLFLSKSLSGALQVWWIRLRVR